MSENRHDDLRTTALRLAARIDAGPESTVKRAQAYYDFLIGKEPANA